MATRSVDAHVKCKYGLPRKLGRFTSQFKQRDGESQNEHTHDGKHWDHQPS